MRRTHAVVMTLAVAALAACDTATQPEVSPQFAKGDNGVVASATGSGVRAGSVRHFQFSANAKADGTTTGQWNLTNEGTGNFSGRGAVLCVHIEGNGAWIGTRIDDATVPELIGTEGGFYVEDNGEGKGSDDLMSLMFVGGDPGFGQAVCDRFTSIELGAVSIDQGNIQVH